MGAIQSYRDLVVWKKGMELAEACYRLAKSMPRSEEYRLTSQLLRAAASIPANIAEGNVRSTRKDYAHFISIARGSVAEVETFLQLAVRVDLLDTRDAEKAIALSDELGRMLNVLRGKLSKQPEKAIPLVPNPQSLIPQCQESLLPRKRHRNACCASAN